MTDEPIDDRDVATEKVINDETDRETSPSEPRAKTSSDEDSDD
jgi:hypothetical protein